MIIGKTFDAIVCDLSSRKTEKSKQVLIVFCDDIALKYYRRYFNSNEYILTSFDEINRKGLVGLRYKEFFVLNFITDIEDIKNEIETFISYFIEQKGEEND